MDIKKFVSTHDIDYTKNTVSKGWLINIQNDLGCAIGPQLMDYLMNYGYPGYESVEFYGINSKQALEYDMILQNIYIHKYFPKTLGYIALESLGEGDYILADENDKVYRYVSESDEIINVDILLFDYIQERFVEE